MKTPNYTLIEYSTDHGLISAVVETAKPGTIVFGFTDHESCMSFLRRSRQRRYLQDGEVRDIPVLPGHTKYDKELDAWYSEFLKEIYPYVTTRRTKVLHTESQREIGHCTVTDTSDLECYYASLDGHDRGIVFAQRTYSSWNGHSDSRVSMGSSEERREIIELIRRNRDAIVRELSLNKYCRP